MARDFSHLDKIAAREIMRHRLPLLLGTDPGCNVRDWDGEADENPHVMQALNQGIAARYAILDALTPSDLAALLAEKCPGWRLIKE